MPENYWKVEIKSQKFWNRWFSISLPDDCVQKKPLYFLCLWFQNTPALNITCSLLTCCEYICHLEYEAQNVDLERELQEALTLRKDLETSTEGNANIDLTIQSTLDISCNNQLYFSLHTAITDSCSKWFGLPQCYRQGVLSKLTIPLTTLMETVFKRTVFTYLSINH